MAIRVKRGSGFLVTVGGSFDRVSGRSGTE